MQIKVEDLLSRLGNPGKFQISVFILLACNYFPVVFNHITMAFYGRSYPHQCQRGRYEDMMLQKVEVSTLGGVVNYTFADNVSVERAEYGKCQSTYYFSDGGNQSVDCGTEEDVKWQFTTIEGQSSIVTEWNLVCGYKRFSSLATTIYFGGVMVGGLLFGYLADKFGRKPVMLATLYMPILIGVGIAFSPSYTAFAVLRFFQGFFIQGLQTTSYVMSMELFLPQYRGLAGALLEVVWGLTVILLAGIAYTFQHWRYIQLAITLPSLLALGYFWLVPESLRWLILQKRVPEVEDLVTKVTKINKLPFPADTMAILKEQSEADSSDNVAQFSFIDLMRTAKLRRLSIILFYLWFAVSVGYYGLLFSMTGLAGNQYLNFFISGSVDLVAFILIIFIVKFFKRKIPMVIFFLIGSLSCIIAGVIPFIWKIDSDEKQDRSTRKLLITGFAIFGKFGMSGVFSLIFLYSSELYPTVIRNIGMSSCAFWARVGGVVAPQVLTLNDITHKSTSMMLIGFVALVGSLLLFLLPETYGKKLPDTIQDVENASYVDEKNMEVLDQEKSMTQLQDMMENVTQ